MNPLKVSTLEETEASWVLAALERVASQPAVWAFAGRMPAGYAFRRRDGLAVIASGQVEGDGRRWLHVSLSRQGRLPSWDDLKDVKAAFVGPEREAYQVLPPEKKFVNIHRFCLHLWCCWDGPALPDFTSDMPGYGPVV